MIQCEGCYYQDKKDNVCCHENPFFDIDDNCTDYIENEFVKKIRADAIEEVKIEYKRMFNCGYTNCVTCDDYCNARKFMDKLEHLKKGK